MSCSLNLKTKIIDTAKDEKILLEELKGLFDDDFNGNNGEEYTSEEAISKGYNSNLSCCFDLLKKEVSDALPLVEKYFHVIQKLIDMNYSDSYYKGYAYTVEKLDENRIHVSIAYHY